MTILLHTTTQLREPPHTKPQLLIPCTRPPAHRQTPRYPSVLPGVVLGPPDRYRRHGLRPQSCRSAPLLREYSCLFWVLGRGFRRVPVHRRPHVGCYRFAGSCTRLKKASGVHLVHMAIGGYGWSVSLSTLHRHDLKATKSKARILIPTPDVPPHGQSSKTHLRIAKLTFQTPGGRGAASHSTMMNAAHETLSRRTLPTHCVYLFVVRATRDTALARRRLWSQPPPGPGYEQPQGAWSLCAISRRL